MIYDEPEHPSDRYEHYITMIKQNLSDGLSKYHMPIKVHTYEYIPPRRNEPAKFLHIELSLGLLHVGLELCYTELAFSPMVAKCVIKGETDRLIHEFVSCSAELSNMEGI